MDRQHALARAAEHFDSGAFFADLERRVTFRTESAFPDREQDLRDYLTAEMVPAVERLGFTPRIVENPVSSRHPFLVARRIEEPAVPTVLTHGHGDVQPAHPEQWRAVLDPWRIVVEGDRWYGRCVADNKGQHSVNLAALAHVLAERDGRLGYNVTLLLDMGEEFGSPGLPELCEQLRDELAADLLIGSDGPRVAADRPTVFLGSRVSMNLTFRVDARPAAHHSGNWGGVLSNPATVLANALVSMVDGRGRLLVEGLRPPAVPGPVRAALRSIDDDQGPDSPVVDPDWGEPGLTPGERLWAWNTLEVLAMTAVDPDAPVKAIPPSDRASCQLRFVVGTDPERVPEVL